jgi:hypothetical protein
MGIDTGLGAVVTDNNTHTSADHGTPFREDREFSTRTMTEPRLGAGDGDRTRVISLEG